MSFAAVYIKSPSNYLILDADYHYITKSLGYELQKIQIGEISYFENSFGTVCIGSESWGIRIRHFGSSNNNNSLLESFITSKCDAKTFITSIIEVNEIDSNDIIILCDGNDIIRYNFQTKKSDLLQPGFYVYGDIENDEKYDELHKEMRNMVEQNEGKNDEMMKFCENFYTLNDKPVGTVYKSIIRKKSQMMIFDEYMNFTISSKLRTKRLFRKIEDMKITQRFDDFVNITY